MKQREKVAVKIGCPIRRRHRIPPPYNTQGVSGYGCEKERGELPRLLVSSLALHRESEPILGCRISAFTQTGEGMILKSKD